MNLKEHFEKTALFLEEYSYLHEKESLTSFPSQIVRKSHSWTQEILSWDNESLAQFESDPGGVEVSSENFTGFLKKIDSLKSIPFMSVGDVNLSSNLSRKLNKKKKHEIKRILSFIDENISQDQFVDIGSGAGHLSNSLVFEKERQSYCIDMDARLQSIGREKIKYWIPENKDKVSFVNEFYTGETSLSNIEPNKSMLLGLHCCGDLSSNIVRSFHEHSYASLLNFGCCYHKINDGFNISELSKQFKPGLTRQSFFLAERTTSYITAEDIKLRRSVKKYRYALHLYLHQKFKLEFSSVGNAKKTDYAGPFSRYAKKYHLGTELNDVKDSELDQYVESEEFLSIFDFLFAQDSIRNLVGRVVEIYIILDRAIYLCEQGHDVDVFQLFNTEISPRNLAIYAKN